MRKNSKGSSVYRDQKRSPFRRPEKPRTRVTQKAARPSSTWARTPEESFAMLQEDSWDRLPEKAFQPEFSQRTEQLAAQGPTEKLQKVLADAGRGSRREMERLIASGVVTINGQVAQVGDRVGPEDLIRIEGRLLRRADRSTPRVLMYHKVAGEIVSRDDPEGRRTVFHRLPHLTNGRWIAVGRLDYNTEGLLLFTTSGALANRLMHPRLEIEREYAVRVIGELEAEAMLALQNGVELDDGPAKFDLLQDEGGTGMNHWYRVRIKEGRNREVRRMFRAVGVTVSRLIRVRYGAVSLPKSLPRGKRMELTPQEVRTWMADLAAQEKRLAPQAEQKAQEARRRKEQARLKLRQKERARAMRQAKRTPRARKNFAAGDDRTGVPIKEGRDMTHRRTQRRR